MARSSRRTPRLTVALASVALAALGSLAAAGPGAAADPPGTITLASGDSSFNQHVVVSGVAAGQIVYQQHADGDLYARPTGGGAPVLVAAGEISHVRAIGDLVSYRNDAGVQAWTNLATHASGTVPNTWAGLGPDGGILLSADGAGVRIRYQRVTDPDHPVDLGTAPVSADGANALGGPDGVVVDNLFTGALSPVAYVRYDQPGTITTLNVTGVPTDQALDCQSVTAAAVGCVSSSRVVRLSLTGGAPVIIQESTTRNAYQVRVTDTATAWSTLLDSSWLVGREVRALGQLHLVAAGGGAVTTPPGYVDIGMAADGSTFYADHLPPTLTGSGIYSTTGPGNDLSLVAEAPPQPDYAFKIGLGPGRVAWTDTGATGRPVWSRTVSTTATSNALAVGDRKQTGSDAIGVDFSALVVSGGRTAYLTTSTDSYDATSSTLHVVDSNGVTTIDGVAEDSSGPVLSGNRLLYTRASDQHQVLYDFAAGTRRDLTAQLAAVGSIALWGDYAGYLTSDGSVWRAKLSGGAPVRLAKPTAYPFRDGSVQMWGDWLAFTRVSSQGLDQRYVGQVRNARTLAPARQTPGATFGAMANGVLTTVDHIAVVQTWSGGTSRPLPDQGNAIDDEHGTRALSLDGSVVAWIGTDELPHVRQFNHPAPNPPRSLGDRVAPASARSGHVWRLDLPTSATLTSCRVLIRRNGATVTTVPCAATAMQVGVARASWKAGRAGGYTWRLAAANGDGALLTASGSKRQVNGTIRVR